MADNNTDPAKLRQEINAENEDPREAMMKGVYAGPDAMSMMMVYAGPAQMQNGGNTQGFMQFMTAYAGPQPDDPAIGSMVQVMSQGGIRPQPREGIYCFCPECGALAALNFCPECGTPLKDAKKYRDCSSCGTRMDADAKFCHECGKPAGSAETMPV